jgi:hypothetical protein
MATFATAPTDPDWFDANFRQVLGIAGTADARRPLSAPQVLTAIGKRFTRVVEPGTHRVTFTRNGAALQLMDDPAEFDPLIATIAAGELGGARAALASIDADLCIPGGCEGDAGKALATIGEMIEGLIEASARRDGAYRVRILISQLIGVAEGPAGVSEFGLIHCLRRRVAAGYRQSPSIPREHALRILDLAISAIESFEGGIGDRSNFPSRPLHDVMDTLQRCAIHISDRLGDVRRTLIEVGIGQCELERAEFEHGQVPITIPDLFSVLDTLPRDWNRLIDGATSDSQQAMAASVQELHGALDALDPAVFAERFPTLGDDASDRLIQAWDGFRAYTLGVLGDLGDALKSEAAAQFADATSDDEALIEAPEEEQKPL